MKTLFLICLALFAVLSAGISGWLLEQAMAQYNRAGRVGRAFDVADLLLSMPWVDLLMADAAAGPASLDKLAEVKRAADAAIADAERLVPRTAGDLSKPAAEPARYRDQGLQINPMMRASDTVLSQASPRL